jgi:hypothetical protein
LPVLPDVSATFGALIWVALVAGGGIQPIADLLALAMLVIAPLGIGLVDTPTRDGSRLRLYTAATVLQPVAAVLAVVGLALPPQRLAILLTLPWVAVGLLLTGVAGWRLAHRGPWPLSELVIDAGLVYLLAGAVFLVFDAAGWTWVFTPPLVTLTAIHYHYAGFALAVFAGMAGRVSDRASLAWTGTLGGDRLARLKRGATAVILVGPPLIAAGITATALSLPLAGFVEFIAVLLFTSAVVAFAVVTLSETIKHLDTWPRRVLVALALLAVIVSMGFALLYGLARLTGGTYAGIHPTAFGRMVRGHGQLNAIGFALVGLVGWRLVAPGSTAREPGIPVSNLAAGGRVGTEFLSRAGLQSDADVRGMVSALSDLGAPGFDPDQVAPEVRQFYEATGDYRLTVRPEWSPYLEPVLGLYRAIATRIGQLSLPLPTPDPAPLTGRVVAIRGPDEAAGTRAWIRSNADRTDGDDQMTYVATYGIQDAGSCRYLRVTFPLPWCNLTGILRPGHSGTGEEGVALSSHRRPGNSDDAGLYLVVRGLPIRLPIDETLTVLPRTEDTVALTAVHTVSLAGRRLVRLQYAIAGKDQVSE